MAIQVITPADLGKGLKIEDNKVVVNRDDLSIPVDVKLAGVVVNKAEHKMTFTLSDGTNIEQDIADFLAVDTDTTLTSGSYAGNKITLVDSANHSVEVDLSTFATEIKDAAATKAGELVNAAKEAQATKDSEQDAKIAALEPKVQALEAAKGTLEAKDTELAGKIAALESKKPTGTELVSLGGTSLGYLVSAADVNAA